MGSRKVIFARHGETRLSREGILQGLLNEGLSQDGIEEATALAKFCSKHEIGTIYSSPLKRCTQTARIVSERINIPIKTDSRLIEICYGKWEGKTKDELAKLPEWKLRSKDKYNFKHPGNYNGKNGESYNEQFSRLSKFLKSIQMVFVSKNILVVSHLGIMRNAKKYFENCSDEKAVEFTPGTNQAYIVEMDKMSQNTSLIEFT